MNNAYQDIKVKIIIPICQLIDYEMSSYWSSFLSLVLSFIFWSMSKSGPCRASEQHFKCRRDIL